MLNRRRFVAMSVSTALIGAMANREMSARAATTKNARMLVGFPSGGSLDVVARLLVERMGGYATSMIVDNRPGAGGRLALEMLKAGEPDGSLLALTPGDQITLFPHVYKKLGYAPLTDFTPVTTVCTFPFVLAVGPKVPANVTTLAHFIDWCRANPELSSYGTAGAGTRPHFLGATLAQVAGFDFVHVPYKGGAPAIQDVIGGHIPACISVLSNAISHVRSGNLRALATTAERRSLLLPSVPTAKEAGYPDFEAVEWFGIFMPARAPNGIAQALHDAVSRALAQDSVKSGLAQHSFEATALPQGEFVSLIRADTARWSDIVKTSGFSPLE